MTKILDEKLFIKKFAAGGNRTRARIPQRQSTNTYVKILLAIKLTDIDYKKCQWTELRLRVTRLRRTQTIDPSTRSHNGRNVKKACAIYLNGGCP